MTTFEPGVVKTGAQGISTWANIPYSESFTPIERN